MGTCSPCVLTLEGHKLCPGEDAGTARGSLGICPAPVKSWGCCCLPAGYWSTWTLGPIQHLLTTLPFGEFPSTCKWHQLELFQVIFINMPTNLYLPSHMLTWVWNNLGSDCSVWLLIWWSFLWHCCSPSEAAERSSPGSPGHLLQNENISAGSSRSLRH